MVSEDMKRSGQSCKDAQSRRTWRRKIKGGLRLIWVHLEDGHYTDVCEDRTAQHCTAYVFVVKLLLQCCTKLLDDQLTVLLDAVE